MKVPGQKRQPRRQRRSPKINIRIEDGRFQIMGLGEWHAYLRDPYHLMLTVPWPIFLLIVVLLYVGINALFALAYLVGDGNLANARPGSFTDAFFFSVQTLASIGYGAMYPQTFYAHILVTVEAIVSLVSIALMTGLAFARFSRPTARVLFSDVAVIMPYDGVPTLMFRAGNQRRNQILEAQLQVFFLRNEISAEGYEMRRFYELRLLRSRTPSFTLSWTAMHPINEHSPLYGITPEDLQATQAGITASLSGIDETVMQVIHARHTYAAQDILWNQRFVDIFHSTPDGHRYLDYEYFHQTVPLDQ